MTNYFQTIAKSLISKNETQSFTLKSKLSVILIFLGSALAGFLTWMLLSSILDARVKSAIKNTPSPIQEMVKPTAFYVLTGTDFWSTNKDAQNGILELALRQSHLTTINGAPIGDDKIKDLITVISDYITTPPSHSTTYDLLNLHGPETIFRLISSSGIAGPNTAQSSDSVDEITEQLASPKTANQSKVLVNSLFVVKMNADSSAAATNLMASMTGNLAAESPGTNENKTLLLWPQIYQFTNHCAEVIQTNDAVRSARFTRTFFGGPDVALMFALCYFVLWMLVVRFRSAKREMASVKEIETLALACEKELKNNNLAVVIKELQSAIEHRPYGAIARQMLKITKNELDIRGDKSDADSLLTWTQNVRDENSSSRWLLTWCGRALPTIGFIWKVYGIAIAMKDSDLIARALGPYEQSAAIAQVSGALGLAFSATFVAFILSLVIGLIDAWEAHYERLVMGRLEQAVLPLLLVSPDPEYHA